MKNFILDNSLKNLGKVVLWQYDKAYRLLSLLKYMQVIFHVSLERFWQYWIDRVLSIESCGEFGCSLWSQLLGISRPIIVDDSGNKRFITAQVFRRLLKAQFFLLKSTPSIENISNYLEILFGISGEDSLSKWVENVSEYGWKTNVQELNSETRPVQQYQVYKAYDKGRVFQFAPNSDESPTNWEVKSDISARENKSWESIREKVEQTTKEADYSEREGLIVLKLYDPNGYCRKMAGASRDSLSIGLSYTFGPTTITAMITRSRKSGVRVVDEGDMAISYAKSEYYDMMLPDQKYLFEQYKDSLLPYPLGIKTNEPAEELILGFDGQENEQYEPNRAYEKGHIFGYVEPIEKEILPGIVYRGDALHFNWECQADISASENTSFESIRSKLKKTSKGDPFIGPIGGGLKPWKAISNYFYNFEIISNPDSEDDYNRSTRYHYRGHYDVTPENYPTLAKIFPPSRFKKGNYAGSTTWTYLDSFVANIPINSLVEGRRNGIRYVYRVPDMSVEDRKKYAGFKITDGENYAAEFGELDLLVVTKTMPSRDVLYDSWKQINASEAYGMSDAIGDIAYRLKWTPIPAEQASQLVKGGYYQSMTEFTIGNDVYYTWSPLKDESNKYGQTDYYTDYYLNLFLRPSKTSFISNSTIQKISR